MARLLSPRWIASHLFAVTMVVVMAGLGVWQLQRLDERRADNEVVVAAISQEPIPLEDLIEGAEDHVDYTSAAATGRYLPDSELLVVNRSFEGSAGYWAVTPLELDDGTLVAVVRGFVPRLVISGDDPRPISPPTGDVTVLGYTFESVSGGRVAQTEPGDVPRLSRLTLEHYEEVLDIDAAPLWLRLVEQAPAQPGDLPVPVPPPEINDGPHLSYAFQWFFFSAGTVVVYALILRRAFHSRPTASAP